MSECYLLYTRHTYFAGNFPDAIKFDFVSVFKLVVTRFVLIGCRVEGIDWTDFALTCMKKVSIFFVCLLQR